LSDIDVIGCERCQFIHGSQASTHGVYNYDNNGQPALKPPSSSIQVNLKTGTASKEKTVAPFGDNGFCLVAWGGIEPPTRGFSTLF